MVEKRRYLELCIVLVAVVLCGLWLRPGQPEAPIPKESATSSDRASDTPSPHLEASQVSINGVRKGMTYQQVTEVLGPTQAFIPPSGELPKLMTFGQQERADGLGYADHTEIGLDDQRRVVYVTGFRLFVGGNIVEAGPGGLQDPKNARLLVEVFGTEGLEKLLSGEKVYDQNLDLVAYPPGDNALARMIFRSGTRP
jgi:hypothetical protein